MNPNVKKGQTVICIKTVVFESPIPSPNGIIVFTAGDSYLCPSDDLLIDNESTQHLVHSADEKDTWFDDHFTIQKDVDIPAYEQSNIWVEQVASAYEAFTYRTENGLDAIDYLIHDLERIRTGEIVFT